MSARNVIDSTDDMKAIDSTWTSKVKSFPDSPMNRLRIVFVNIWKVLISLKRFPRLCTGKPFV